jgi:RNA polymerase sigma-70 factor (ECF subfamily)
MEDVEIVADFKKAATKERAFTLLVKKYQERLYWHIRRLLPAHEDANDVLQNTFIKVWNGLESFREDSRLYTWLYRIATNECLSFLEQQKKKAVVDFDQLGDAYSNSVRADANFDANRLEWKLQLAIRQLPDKQKLVFNLRYFDEMSYDEMSSILDTSVGALKASYHHAAKKIEEFIKNH